MKKSFKKILSLVVAIAMLASMLCITSFAEETETTVTETVVTDDFDSYDQEASAASSLTTGGNRYVAQINDVDSTTWKAASSGFGTDGAAHAGITADPADSTNNVLAIESRSTYSKWSTKPKVFYENLDVNSNDTYTYKFDFYKSSNSAGGGIMVSYDGTNYYAVDFNGRNDHGYGYSAEATEVYSTVAIKNGEYKTDAVINTDPETTTVSRVAHDFIPSAAWYTMELTVAGGSLNWTVKLTSTGATVQTGSWTDSTPITGTDLSFALFAGGQNSQYMYFDNLTVTKTTVTDDGTGGDDTGSGDDNTGDDNTGDDNTGDDNTGDDEGGDDPVAPTEEFVTVAEDDFSVYDQEVKTVSTTTDGTTTYNLQTGGGRYIAQTNGADASNWYASSGNYFGVSNQARAGIVQNPAKLADTDAQDNVLAIEGRCTYSAWASRPRIIYQNYSASKYNKHVYKFDMYKGSNVAGGGIIFNFDGDETARISEGDHYAIDFVGRNDHAYGYSSSATEVYSTVVIKNGEWQEDAVINTNPETSTLSRVAHDFVPATTWYTVEVTVDGGEISWTVTDAASGAVKQTGLWTDPDPIDAELTSFSLYAGGDYNAYTYFDNVSVKCSTITKPNCKISRDKLTVGFSPKAVEGIENAEKLQVVVAYYDNDTNKLLGVDIREVTDFTEDFSEKFTLDDTVGYVKTFIWNGEVASAMPAYNALEKEREGKFIVTDVTQIGDPQVVLFGDTYYCYSTSSSAKGFKYTKSTDLVNWTDLEYCYEETEGNNTWADNYFWAPEVVYNETTGKYVMHYSAGNESSSGAYYKYRVGVATSDSPEGPFVSVTNGPMFDFGYNAIDASLLKASNGKNYLYFSKDCFGNEIEYTDEDGNVTSVGTSQTYVIEVDETYTQVLSDEATFCITPQYDYEMLAGYGNYWNEGPTVTEYTTKSGDIKYIMNYSANHWRTNYYAICMAVADDPMGPWTKPDTNPVLSQRGDLFGAGHNVFFTGKDGKLYTSFHVQTFPEDPDWDRRLCIGRVLFEEDEEGNITQRIVGATYREDIDIMGARVNAVGTTTIKALFETAQSTWASSATDGVTTAFIGDSYMNKSFWKDAWFNASYSGKNALRVGVSSSRSSDWIETVDEVFGDIAPKNVVINLGTNDVSAGKLTTTTVQNIKELCTTIHELYPEAKIYYFSITPFITDTYPTANATNINSALEGWFNTQDYATYVDTEGMITSDMMQSDLMHMTQEGYNVFVEQLAAAGCVIE